MRLLLQNKEAININALKNIFCDFVFLEISHKKVCHDVTKIK